MIRKFRVTGQWDVNEHMEATNTLEIEVPDGASNKEIGELLFAALPESSWQDEDDEDITEGLGYGGKGINQWEEVTS
jgi:hypothetical protein